MNINKKEIYGLVYTPKKLVDEILDLIMRVFCDPGSDKIITIPPTYGMYDVIAKTNNVENIEVPLKSNFTLNLEEFW